jgi:leucyl-tRNA---protein transferase
MDDATPERYLQFLTSHWADTIFYEFRLEKQLLAVAVVDVLATGLLAVYTFFDPAFEKRGLGTFAVLWEIEEVKRLRLEWLYLGYWIENCRKMSYKTNYQPIEYYSNFQWIKHSLHF